MARNLMTPRSSHGQVNIFTKHWLSVFPLIQWCLWCDQTFQFTPCTPHHNHPNYPHPTKVAQLLCFGIHKAHWFLAWERRFWIFFSIHSANFAFIFEIFLLNLATMPPYLTTLSLSQSKAICPFMDKKLQTIVSNWMPHLRPCN